MPTADFLKEMSWSDRRREEQRHFAAQKSASTEQLEADRLAAEKRASDQREFARCADVATERVTERARTEFLAEQRRVEERIASTSFSSRQALQVYITYERKGRTPHGLTTRDHDELRALMTAIWPAYAAARGIPEDQITSTTAEQQAAFREAQS